MSLPENEIKSQLSHTYLHAISVVAGYPCEVTSRLVDNLSIDARLTIEEKFGPSALYTNFNAEVQLKATSQACTFDKSGRHGFDLDVKAYDRFRSVRCANLMLFVLLVLPQDPLQWLKCSTQALSIRGCAYWVSLYGAADVTNQERVRISVRKRNRLSVDSLKGLVTKFAHGEVVVYEN